ncbi:MAG: hypothetical protein MUF71_13790 [Candidatus Kapabacteria bacterium]|jgi:hypothetical protein|nr:hypothetical protein [Candidatus Kapabacteria bacterium]
MLPQAKAYESSSKTSICQQEKAANTPIHYAAPPDAQQEQGTTTEKNARAAALSRSVSPLLLVSATCYFVPAEGVPSRPDRAK